MGENLNIFQNNIAQLKNTNNNNVVSCLDG